MGERLDRLLVSRGLIESRAKAQAAIEAGGVVVDGRVIDKPSASIGPGSVIVVTPAHPWVSRGGVKLAFALDHFGVDVDGRACVDIGASTGGFCQVLLARGAGHVVAVDVGRDQLHPRLRGDARITALEGVDSRALSAADFSVAPQILVCDVSFISSAQALAIPLQVCAREAQAIVLIKPQFEAGKDAVRDKRGHLDDADAEAAAARAAQALDGMQRFALKGLVESPIRGGEGAREWLAHLQREP